MLEAAGVPAGVPATGVVSEAVWEAKVFFAVATRVLPDSVGESLEFAADVNRRLREVDTAGASSLVVLD